MATRSRDVDLATQLHEWATREMHFHPQGAFQGASMPTPDDLRRICRNTHQIDMWRYVIDHVRSLQTVKKVMGNIQLKEQSQDHRFRVKSKAGSRSSDERDKLLAEREQLLGEITTVLSETRQLENELGRMQTDAQEAQLEYQKEIESQRDIARKTCLLNVYAQTADNFTSTMDEFADRIDGKTNNLVRKNRGVDTALHSRRDEAVVDDNGDDDDTSYELETAVARETRVSCQQIGQFLHQTLQGTFSKDRAAFQVNKDQLWKQVENTLSDFNVEQIVASLVRQSQQGAQKLKEHTLKISIQKDAEKLRFKYEKGGVLTDTAEQPSLLQSVRQLLEESQLQHVQRFVETEKHRNDTQPLLHTLEKIRTKTDAALRKLFAAQPGNVQMANLLIESQLSLVGDQTAQDAYKQEADRLREAIARGHQQQDAVLSLHRRIQDFQELANAKQNLIQVVAKQNGGARSRLAAQQLDVSQYVDRSMPAHQAEVRTLTFNLQGGVTQEVDAFSTLALPYLAYLYLDSETKSSLLDLSIHHTSHPASICVHRPLHSALSHLAFPRHKAADYILQHCLQLKQEKEDAEQVIQALEDHCHKILLTSGLQTDIDNVPELCEKVKKRDQEDLSRLLPVLHKRISKAAEVSTECIKVKDCIQDWWDQPAQFTAPWVKVDNMNFQQWHNKWKIIVTKIRQMDVK